MTQVTVGWIENNSYRSERHVPTLWIGQRNLKLGSVNDINLLIIDGFDKISQNYMSNLQNVGYNIINAEKEYNYYSDKYRSFDRFGQYEKRCFLRWLVIRDFFSDQSIIHYDGDIVFNEIPEKLERLFGKFTFVLEGCPAFVSINNPEWLEVYEDSLNIFSKNIEEYSLQAWKERDGWEMTNGLMWAGCRFRKIISSDQDLISHLIHTKKLPQERPRNIQNAGTDLILFQNPQYFFIHNMDLSPFNYYRSGGVDYFNKRKVAFWHMQNHFVEYLKIALFLKKLKISTTIPNIFEYPENMISKLSFNPLFKNPLFKKFLTLKWCRLDICRYYFEKSNFNTIFNENNFWKKEIF